MFFFSLQLIFSYVTNAFQKNIFWILPMLPEGF